MLSVVCFPLLLFGRRCFVQWWPHVQRWDFFFSLRCFYSLLPSRFFSLFHSCTSGNSLPNGITFFQISSYSFRRPMFWINFIFSLISFFSPDFVVFLFSLVLVCTLLHSLQNFSFNLLCSFFSVFTARYSMLLVLFILGCHELFSFNFGVSTMHWLWTCLICFDCHVYSLVDFFLVFIFLANSFESFHVCFHSEECVGFFLCVCLCFVFFFRIEFRWKLTIWSFINAQLLFFRSGLRHTVWFAFYFIFAYSSEYLVDRSFSIFFLRRSY